MKRTGRLTTARGPVSHNTLATMLHSLDEGGIDPQPSPLPINREARSLVEAIHLLVSGEVRTNGGRALGRDGERLKEHPRFADRIGAATGEG